MRHHIPQRTTDPYSLSNDTHGYAVYGFILIASVGQQAAVQEIRDAVRNQRSMLPAHVTVKGPVCDIPSIEEAQEILDQAAGETPALRVMFDGRPRLHRSRAGEVSAMMPIVVTPELAGLHERLLKALDPVSTTAYPLDATGEYRPHLTIYHEPLPEFEAHGEELLKTLSIGDGFDATEVYLVGHAGTPFRGEWKPISTHSFTG